MKAPSKSSLAYMARQNVSFSPRVPSLAIKTSPYLTRLSVFTPLLEIYLPVTIVSNISFWLISIMPQWGFTSILGAPVDENVSPFSITSFIVK